MEVEKIRGESLSKEELAMEMSKLKKHLAERGYASKGDQKAGFKLGRKTKKGYEMLQLWKERTYGPRVQRGTKMERRS